MMLLLLPLHTFCGKFSLNNHSFSRLRIRVEQTRFWNRKPVSVLAQSRHFRRDVISDTEDEDDDDDDDARQEDNLSDFSPDVDSEAETLELLEWPLVCQQISGFCSTPIGVSSAQSSVLPIGNSREESQALQDQTAAAQRVANSLDFIGAKDVRRIVDKAAALQQICKVDELCLVKDTLECGQRLDSQLSANLPELLPLQRIIKGLKLCSDLREDISRCLDSKREIVLDNASFKLAEVRRQRQENMSKLETLLRETARKVVEAGGIDSMTITTRRARLCIAVRSSHRFLLPGGVVLDSSNTGATLFIEPEPALKLNNVEMRLNAAERAEETAVLKRLTGSVAKNAEDLLALLKGITLLDFACARAKHAKWLGGVRPVFCGGDGDGRGVCIEQIRHPLLLGAALKDSSANVPVAINIKVEAGVKVVIISGPNTGGKTVALKTLGIASIMAKAGLFLPSSEDPQLPWFDRIFADVGDSQSLQQNLSTFSGHIKRLCRIIEASGSQSLVLIDEIGGGTDPAEGSSLAAAVLKYLSKTVNLCMVTTHSASLKTLPVHKDLKFTNASVEFDLETLRPTYRILWGVAGQSNALNIAESFQFDSRIIQRANDWLTKLTPVGLKSRQSDLMLQLGKQSEEEQYYADKAGAYLDDIQKLHQEVSSEAEDLEKRKVALKRLQVAAVNKNIAEAKSKMEAVLTRFKEGSVSQGRNSKSLSLRAAQEEITGIVTEYSPSQKQESLHPVTSPGVGERVIIRRLGKKPATVLQPADDSGHLVVQLGAMKMRVKSNELGYLEKPVAPKQAKISRGMFYDDESERTAGEPLQFAAAVQTSRNTVDVRGLTVEDALQAVRLTIAQREGGSVLFIIHGIGTGALKQAVVSLLQRHPNVAKFENESFINGGCTVAYISF